jgi:hypothetical protein
MTLTKNAIKNLVSTYAIHYVMCKEYEENDLYDEIDLYDDVEYSHHKAYCAAAEEWMRAIGIDHQSNFVMEIIEREKK